MIFGGNTTPKRRTRQPHKPWRCKCQNGHKHQYGWRTTCPDCEQRRPQTSTR